MRISDWSSDVCSSDLMLDVANPDQSLRLGMTATADILTEERNNVLLVPNAALRFKPNTGGDRDSTLIGSLQPRGPRRRRAQRSAQPRTSGRWRKQHAYILE